MDTSEAIPSLSSTIPHQNGSGEFSFRQDSDEDASFSIINCGSEFSMSSIDLIRVIEELNNENKRLKESIIENNKLLRERMKEAHNETLHKRTYSKQLLDQLEESRNTIMKLSGGDNEGIESTLKSIDKTVDTNTIARLQGEVSDLTYKNKELSSMIDDLKTSLSLREFSAGVKEYDCDDDTSFMIVDDVDKIRSQLMKEKNGLDEREAYLNAREKDLDLRAGNCQTSSSGDVNTNESDMATLSRHYSDVLPNLPLNNTSLDTFKLNMDSLLKEKDARFEKAKREVSELQGMLDSLTLLTDGHSKSVEETSRGSVNDNDFSLMQNKSFQECQKELISIGSCATLTDVPQGSVSSNCGESGQDIHEKLACQAHLLQQKQADIDEITSKFIGLQAESFELKGAFEAKTLELTAIEKECEIKRAELVFACIEAEAKQDELNKLTRKVEEQNHQIDQLQEQLNKNITQRESDVNRLQKRGTLLEKSQSEMELLLVDKDGEFQSKCAQIEALLNDNEDKEDKIQRLTTVIETQLRLIHNLEEHQNGAEKESVFIKELKEDNDGLRKQLETMELILEAKEDELKIQSKHIGGRLESYNEQRAEIERLNGVIKDLEENVNELAVYKIQAEVFETDFKNERDDRTQAASTITELSEELQRAHIMIEELRARANVGGSHHGHATAPAGGLNNPQRTGSLNRGQTPHQRVVNRRGQERRGFDEIDNIGAEGGQDSITSDALRCVNCFKIFENLDMLKEHTVECFNHIA